MCGVVFTIYVENIGKGNFRINGGKRKNVNLKKKVRSNILLRLLGYKAMNHFQSVSVLTLF